MKKKASKKKFKFPDFDKMTYAEEAKWWDTHDIGDYWEFIDQPHYKLKPSAEALKIGVNIAIYAMTH